jgi:hypothetical protein
MICDFHPGSWFLSDPRSGSWDPKSIRYQIPDLQHCSKQQKCTLCFPCYFSLMMAGYGSASGSVHLTLFRVNLSLSKLYINQEMIRQSTRKSARSFTLNVKLSENLYSKKDENFNCLGATRLYCVIKISVPWLCCLIFPTLGTPFPFRSTETKPICV